MQALHRLLFFIFYRDKTHVGPSDGFANCQRISGVIFTGFTCQPVWRNEFWSHQFNVVTVLLEKPCPVVSPEACLHPNNAGWQAGNEFGQRSPGYFGFNENSIAIFINAMNGKKIFSEVDPNSYNGYGYSTVIFWLLPIMSRKMVTVTTSREVPFIRFNRTYRTEILDFYLFRTLNEAREITERWLMEYNNERPHESLNNLTPEEYRLMAEKPKLSKSVWN